MLYSTGAKIAIRGDKYIFAAQIIEVLEDGYRYAPLFYLWGRAGVAENGSTPVVPCPPVSDRDLEEEEWACIHGRYFEIHGLWMVKLRQEAIRQGYAKFDRSTSGCTLGELSQSLQPFGLTVEEMDLGDGWYYLVKAANFSPVFARRLLDGMAAEATVLINPDRVYTVDDMITEIATRSPVAQEWVKLVISSGVQSMRQSKPIIDVKAAINTTLDRLPDMPCPESEMTERELAIAQPLIQIVGFLTFIRDQV